jgi:hypothetical protein
VLQPVPPSTWRHGGSLHERNAASQAPSAAHIRIRASLCRPCMYARQLRGSESIPPGHWQAAVEVEVLELGPVEARQEFVPGVATKHAGRKGIHRSGSMSRLRSSSDLMSDDNRRTGKGGNNDVIYARQQRGHQGKLSRRSQQPRRCRWDDRGS